MHFYFFKTGQFLNSIKALSLANLGYLRHFLYACVIIDTVKCKAYAFGSKAVPHASAPEFYFVLFKQNKKTMKKTLFQNPIIALFSIAILVFSSCGQSTAQKEGAPDIDLHTAVITGNEEAVKQHIAAGSDLNARDPFGGSSPLITAAVFGKPQMAALLLDAGADINFQNNDGSTALISAAFFGRPEAVQMLLERGADKTIKNKYGTNAYENVAPPFSDVKEVYDVMGGMLGPMGLKLDYAYLEKIRPEIAKMLK